MDPITHFMWIAFIVVAILLLISATDELLLDIIFIYYRISRLWKTKKYKYEPLTYEKLSELPEKKIAILVPCWQEDQVIESMLNHNVSTIDYKQYDFFVVGYVNDPLTIDAIKRVQERSNHIHCVINEHSGPTSKADNLNAIYKYIQEYELKKNIHYDIFVFHDCEDIIHPLSLKMYNYLIPRKDMVQIPIFPLEVPSSYFIHWTYADEFAENHTRIMIVREFIHGLVPSAGVGVGFSRSAIDRLANTQNGIPFDLLSLTEDYSVALQIHDLKLKSIFLTQTIEEVQAKKKWIWFGPLVPKRKKILVATRALFPKKYMPAVRQRTRWVTGISLQQWKKTGWTGNLATRYTLFHDRKALISNFINFAGYILLIYWILHSLLDQKPSLLFLMSLHPMVWYLTLACTFLMLIRIFQRILSTNQIYGCIPALLSIPRIVYGNMINFHAILRAYRGFFFARGKKTVWDKTKNAFATEHELKLYKKKLGDLLVENRLITSKQLNDVLVKQVNSREKLGTLLVQEHLIDPKSVLNILAKQYHMEVADIKSFRILAPHELPLSEETYAWLLKNEFLPIAFSNNMITLAIINPSDQALRSEAIRRLTPIEIKFVLSSNAVKF